MQPDAKVYVQFSCQLRPLKQLEYQKIGLYVALTFIICCIFFTVALYYSEMKSDLNYTEWDFQTATVNDFSVMFLITD